GPGRSADESCRHGDLQKKEETAHALPFRVSRNHAKCLHPRSDASATTPLLPGGFGVRTMNLNGHQRLIFHRMLHGMAARFPALLAVGRSRQVGMIFWSQKK